MLLCRALESGEKTLQDPPGTVHEFTDWQQQLVHLGQRIEFGCLPEGGVKDHMAEQEQLYTKWLGLFREEMMKREREALAKKHELEKSKLAEESARNAKKWRLEERGRMEEEEERESRKLRWEFLGL